MRATHTFIALFSEKRTMAQYKKLLLSLIGIALAVTLTGCCCASTPSPSSGSSSCSLGTYGSACTDACSKYMPGDEGCFTKCMDSVRSEGLGDSTTCCKQSFRQWCEPQCDQPGWSASDVSDCKAECQASTASTGISYDSCYLPIY